MTIAWFFVCLAGSLAQAADPAASGVAADIVQQDGRIRFLVNGRNMAEYQFQPVPFKPYIKRLCTPSGLNLLRDNVPDHPHHHGLMFALGVDGIDFWGETPGCGKQKHRTVAVRSSTKTVTANPPRSADRRARGRIDEHLEWADPTGRCLLTESRSITIDVRPDVTLLTWRSALRRPESMPPARIAGRHYFGLGVRFVQAMDADGPFFNPDNRPGTVYRGDERLVTSRWCAYRARLDDRDVTVAMFDAPDNPRPATWFIMARPFAYLSATMAYHKEPMQLPPGKTLTVVYAVALWDGAATPNQIEAAYRDWLEHLPRPPISDRPPKPDAPDAISPAPGT